MPWGRGPQGPLGDRQGDKRHHGNALRPVFVIVQRSNRACHRGANEEGDRRGDNHMGAHCDPRLSASQGHQERGTVRAITRCWGRTANPHHKVTTPRTSPKGKKRAGKGANQKGPRGERLEATGKEQQIGQRDHVGRTVEGTRTASVGKVTVRQEHVWATWGTLKSAWGTSKSASGASQFASGASCGAASRAKLFTLTATGETCPIGQVIIAVTYCHRQLVRNIYSVAL